MFYQFKNIKTRVVPNDIVEHPSPLLSLILIVIVCRCDLEHVVYMWC